MGTLLHSCVKVCPSIKMPFGVVSGVSRRMGILDVGPRVPMGRGGFGVFSPIGLNGIF